MPPEINNRIMYDNLASPYLFSADTTPYEDFVYINELVVSRRTMKTEFKIGDYVMIKNDLSNVFYDGLFFSFGLNCMKGKVVKIRDFTMIGNAKVMDNNYIISLSMVNKVITNSK